MWLLLFLMFQTLATTEHGEKVLLKDDGTWSMVEEKAPEKVSRLVYIDVIPEVSTFTGMWGTQVRNDFNPSKTEIAKDLAKHGIQATMNPDGARLIFRVESKTWSIISPAGEILYYEQNPATMWNN